MESMELLFVCLSAFIMVFVLLSLLAAVMRLITGVFPQLADRFDSAAMAAAVAAVSAVYPGTKVTKVEEIQ